MRKAFTLAVAFLCGSCGPLSALSASGDVTLNSLEKCCEERIVAGKDITLCETAFEQHRDFVRSWEHANLTGEQGDIGKAAHDLQVFQYYAQTACTGD